MTWYRSKRFWIIALGIVLASTLLLAWGNLVQCVRLKRQIAVLEERRDAYRARIAADSLLLEELRYDEYLEAYAREHYRLQKQGETVYIIEE